MLAKARGTISKMAHSHGCWLQTLVPQGLLAGALTSSHRDFSIGLQMCPNNMATGFPKVRCSETEQRWSCGAFFLEMTYHNFCFLLVTQINSDTTWVGATHDVSARGTGSLGAILRPVYHIPPLIHSLGMQNPLGIVAPREREGDQLLLFSGRGALILHRITAALF
jgi:hypothetical protein